MSSRIYLGSFCILGGFCPTRLHVTSCSLVCCVKHNVITFSMVMINSSAEALTCNTQLHKRLGVVFVVYILVMKVT